MTGLHRWALPIYLLCITTAILWLLRGSLTVANFTMIYIFVILIIAIQRGTQMALVSSFVSFLCINFFLIHPYYTLIVADPREVLDLIVFFMVSVLVGQLAAYARKQAGFEEADRLKTALLYAIAHDLRTPITILKTSTSNLHTLDERLSPVEREELIQVIADEIDELDKLIGNLLNLSRLRVGAMTLDKQPNSLEEVAGDVAAHIYQHTRQERVWLNMPSDLPMVSFDYGLILQALTNLVDNAVRYEPPLSQVELRVVITSKIAQLWVVNHGNNITPEEKNHILQPFYHGKNGRIGLGLPIAKGIIEAHHGRLLLQDTTPKGATFIIELPRETR
jgi:two-component system sensor histidine kinase KdpD